MFRSANLTNVPVIHILEPARERLKVQIEVLALNTHDDGNKENLNSWTQVYKEYLQHGLQPNNNNEARMLRMKSSRRTMIDGILSKKSTTGSLQRCLKREEADKVLKDVHEGDCGNHANRRNLPLKILRMEYYWPMLRQDALEYTRKCDACQRLNIYTLLCHLDLS